MKIRSFSLLVLPALLTAAAWAGQADGPKTLAPAQNSGAAADTSQKELKQGWREAGEAPTADATDDFVVDAGTRIPLALINSVSTKNAVVGDRVYLETVFPVVVRGKVVVPAGSYVMGTVTQVKRPGRIKGKGELYIRFDSLTLPNGTVRDFRSRVGNMDATSDGKLDREEGSIEGSSNKGGDARTIAEGAAAGASVGTIAGVATGNVGRGFGIGGAAGAAAGLIGVLATRGPDVLLTRGSTVEMILDRNLGFEEEELNFSAASTQRPAIMPVQQNTQQRQRVPGSRLPF